MKRMISVALVALMVAALLAACGGGSGAANAAGEYYVKTLDGKTMEETLKEELKDVPGIDSIDDYLKLIDVSSLNEMLTLNLNNDGSAKMEMKMTGSETEGTWKQDGNKVTFTFDDTTTVFTLNGNELSNDEGSPKFVFVKK